MFVRNQSASYTDVTLVTIGVSNKVKDWEVSLEESLSLHRYMTYTIKNKDVKKKQIWKGKPVLDKEVLRNAFSILSTERPYIGTLTKNIRTAQKLACIVNNAAREREQSYWWCQDIDDLRNQC